MNAVDVVSDAVAALKGGVQAADGVGHGSPRLRVAVLGGKIPHAATDAQADRPWAGEWCTS